MSESQGDKLNTAQQAESADANEAEIVKTMGERLREAREAKSLQLRDVARETRQSQDTLASLEEMETEHIPDSILRLQARNYARFLGLPEEEVASAYAANRGATNASAMPVEVEGKSVPTRMILVAAASVFAIGVVGTGVSLLLQPATEQSTDQLAISARLAPNTVQEIDFAALRADAGQEFSLRAKESAWIEVRGSDGTVFRSRNMSAGETYFPRTGAGWTITVRDAGAFEWRLGDDVYAAVGEDEQALYSLSVDNVLDAAVAAQSAALADAAASSEQRR
ncbi:MAG: helix-turn-helix domain-containing protein [Henriciella sp.]|nr:helix-turn-helix domain-containing protein [Henriciella sp.]